MAILKFIFTLMLLYLVFKWMYRMFVPAPIRHLIDQLKHVRSQGAYYQEPVRRPEGSVTVQTHQTTSKTTRNDDEYVDFEEVD